MKTYTVWQHLDNGKKEISKYNYLPPYGLRWARIATLHLTIEEKEKLEEEIKVYNKNKQKTIDKQKNL